MTPCQVTPETSCRPEPCFWSRFDTAQAFADFSDPFRPPCSQRDYAEQHGIPRSTLGYWLREEFPDHLDKDFVAFFRSPPGQAFLRRLLLSVLLVFHHRNPCGLHAVSQFLELVDLHHFVGSSYGALYDLDQHLQDDLIRFGQEERQRLTPGMTAKDIVLCGDEHFHSACVCLIAMEPVSNFILVEGYYARRDSQTWGMAINTGIDGLPVTVVVFTTDQASGLIRCAEKELKALYQPDLFHLQFNLGKPVLLPLARPVHQAEKELQKAQQETQRLDQTHQQNPMEVSVAELLEAVQEEGRAKQQLEQTQQKLDRAVAEIRAVGEVYHPFDRETGQPVTVEQMQTRLSEPLQRLQQVVEEAGLGELRSSGGAEIVRVGGGVGWLPRLVSHDGAEPRGGTRSERRRPAVVRGMPDGQLLLGGGQPARERPRREDAAGGIGQTAKGTSLGARSALAALSEAEKERVQQTAQQCVHLFCRSSSCVEGRNGRLSLFHHGQTRLSEKRLRTLTVVHNYVVRRPDGTTAAERFFGQKQRDAFDWLLQRMPELPRPAAKRPKQASKAGLVAA